MQYWAITLVGPEGLDGRLSAATVSGKGRAHSGFRDSGCVLEGDIFVGDARVGNII
jgi:hypothetical protein